jgi:hypothetical protein
MRKFTRRICVLTTILLSTFAWASIPVSARSQGLDAKKKEVILAFAEKFVVACSKEDAPALKEMMAFPFWVYAPCKGGDHDSVEEFTGNILRRGNGIQLPKAYETRKVIALEKYVRANSWAYGNEKDMGAHLKILGKDVHVACLIQGRKDGDFALAVLVRTTREGVRAIGLGGIDWRELKGAP